MTRPDATQRQPRAIGNARVSSVWRDGASRLDGLYQSGASKLLLPRHAGPDLQAVLLNTAGGVTGGDRFRVEASAEAQSALSVTTQAAERIYRAAQGETGRIDITLKAGPQATLDWLPQETIIFDGASLRRTLTIDLAADARALICEAYVLGRTAMGETVRDLYLSDAWTLRRDGKLAYADTLRIDGDAIAATSGPGTLGGAIAFASLMFATPRADMHLAALRAALPGTGGASLLAPDLISIRLIEADGLALRRVLLPILRMLRTDPLPKLWTL